MMTNQSRYRAFLIAALSVWSMLASLNVLAEERLTIPEETFGPPFYARLEFAQVDPSLIPTNGEWAALVLYRQRQCIPESFNLLTLFDAPAAFDCPLGGYTGYEVYTISPEFNVAPAHTRLTGTGESSIWFVRLDEFQQAAANGLVTIVDFENMPSLRKGTADFYEELLRPSQSNSDILLHTTAHGRLEDGGGFRLTYTVTGDPQIGTQVRTRIEFPSVDELPEDAPMSSPFTGHWFEPGNPGEGLGIHPIRGRDQVFGTWYTVSDTGEQIWYALDSTAFDGLRASFDILLSFGADPDAANGVALEKVGEMEIDFFSCTSATASYTLGDTNGFKQLRSLVPADDCSD